MRELIVPGHAPEKKVETVTVILGGKEVEVPLDDLWLYKGDAMTVTFEEGDT